MEHNHISLSCGACQIAMRALKVAHEVLLFRHEMGGGYVPQDVLTAVHQIDAALGNEPTALRCAGDS